MKKMRLIFVCLALVMACVLAFTACNSNTPAETEAATQAATEAATQAATEAATQAATEAATGEADTAEVDTAEANTAEADTAEADTAEADTSEADTGLSVEGIYAEYPDFKADQFKIISTPDELMAWATEINALAADMEYYWDMVVIFTADIDMTGYEWAPIDGRFMDCVYFEGMGHTISNLTFVDYRSPYAGAPATELGCGFVGVAGGSMSFKDLTLDSSTVTAYERHVGNFIGQIYCEGGESIIDFENCKSLNFTVNGWMDITDTNAEERRSICQRVAGFIGHHLGGATVTFTDCAVENMTATAYQNLAGFIAYDGSNSITEFSFVNCSVKGASFTFNYSQKFPNENYQTVLEQPKKYVSVFYNGGQWIDNIDAVVAAGNTYSDVSYFDNYNDNQEYSVNDFRSWSYDDANPEQPAA